MRYQRGVTLLGLVAWGIVIGLVAILAVKVVPDVVEFYKIKKVVAATAANSDDKTVAEIRNIYEKYADIDQIQTIRPVDLDIYKEGSRVIIAFAYEKRIPLFANASLVLDFQGSSVQASRGR
jgi:Tfp pilus assembly major pilin PilA